MPRSNRRNKNCVTKRIASSGGGGGCSRDINRNFAKNSSSEQKAEEILVAKDIDYLWRDYESIASLRTVLEVAVLTLLVRGNVKEKQRQKTAKMSSKSNGGWGDKFVNPMQDLGRSLLNFLVGSSQPSSPPQPQSQKDEFETFAGKAKVTKAPSSPIILRRNSVGAAGDQAADNLKVSMDDNTPAIQSPPVLVSSLPVVPSVVARKKKGKKAQERKSDLLEARFPDLNIIQQSELIGGDSTSTSSSSSHQQVGHQLVEAESGRRRLKGRKRNAGRLTQEAIPVSENAEHPSSIFLSLIEQAVEEEPAEAEQLTCDHANVEIQATAQTKTEDDDFDKEIFEEKATETNERHEILDKEQSQTEIYKQEQQQQQQEEKLEQIKVEESTASNDRDQKEETQESLESQEEDIVSDQQRSDANEAEMTEPKHELMPESDLQDQRLPTLEMSELDTPDKSSETDFKHDTVNEPSKDGSVEPVTAKNDCQIPAPPPPPPAGFLRVAEPAQPAKKKPVATKKVNPAELALLKQLEHIQDPTFVNFLRINLNSFNEDSEQRSRTHYSLPG